MEKKNENMRVIIYPFKLYETVVKNQVLMGDGDGDLWLGFWWIFEIGIGEIDGDQEIIDRVDGFHSLGIKGLQKSLEVDKLSLEYDLTGKGKIEQG